MKKDQIPNRWAEGAAIYSQYPSLHCFIFPFNTYCKNPCNYKPQKAFSQTLTELVAHF